MTSYIDADLAGNLKHHRSTFASVFLLNGGVISWANKKHTYVYLSTMELEFIVAISAVKEGVW